jgi:transcriptional regulator with PAS, ATPase and Fis domain
MTEAKIMQVLEKLQEQHDCRLKFAKIVTCSDLMLPVFDQASRAAAVDTTALIRGESGTGKELIAEAIHNNSPRREGPYVIVNMAAVPENLIESELFGHVPGAFTGASVKRLGRFALAQGGTLFIDEIGDLALECQAKLLRVLENRHFTPVGSNEDVHTDARVIAATNRNLEKMVQRNEFREDLYYRLNVVSIALPPLRDRPEDIRSLTGHFLDQLAQTYDRPLPTPDEELLRWMESYPWPGNIRELRNCVESMFVLANSATLSVDDLPDMIRRGERRHWTGIDIPEGLTLDEVVRAVIERALERWQGNRTKAANSLGISVRTLQRRLKKWEGQEA